MDFVEIIISFLIVILGIAGAYVITSIANYFVAKKDEITKTAISKLASCNNETANKAIEFAIEQVSDIVNNVVSALNATYKKELLEATKDGKLTDTEKKLLRDKALELINAEVADPIKETLKVVVGNFDEYIKTLIENAVEMFKRRHLK